MADLTRFGAAGERIVLTGRITDGDRRTRHRCRVELWQADPPASDRFPGWGRCGTDGDGRYRFTTIRPGPVPGRGQYAASAAFRADHPRARHPDRAAHPRLFRARGAQRRRSRAGHDRRPRPPRHPARAARRRRHVAARYPSPGRRRNRVFRDLTGDARQSRPTARCSARSTGRTRCARCSTSARYLQAHARRRGGAGAGAGAAGHHPRGCGRGDRARGAGREPRSRPSLPPVCATSAIRWSGWCAG